MKQKITLSELKKNYPIHYRVMEMKADWEGLSVKKTFKEWGKNIITDEEGWSDYLKAAREELKE